ncbi:MAG: DUF2141 domain-containing protein [Cyclobacteriaceae bacterium]|nr:DUF2141 domain-containing protein [Cyclobacteriaceae bacterium]
MKIIFKIFCIAILSNNSNNLFAQSYALTVHILNIKDDSGQIAIAVYNSDKSFMKTRYQGKVTKANKGEVEVIFENLPVGFYSLSVMHDSNENGKLDSNFFGVPKEGFGFSNNAIGSLGPPHFEKARIDLPSDKKISITLKYM